MINELIVGKIILESTKYLLKTVVKEENITLRILSSLSDITTFGMSITFWLLLNNTDGKESKEKSNKIPENMYS